METTKAIIIRWELGLHMRPAAQIAKLLKPFNCEIKFVKNGESCNAKSLMQLITLAASSGETIQIVAQGNDAQEAMEALERFFATYKDEPILGIPR